MYKISIKKNDFAFLLSPTWFDNFFKCKAIIISLLSHTVADKQNSENCFYIHSFLTFFYIK